MGAAGGETIHLSIEEDNGRGLDTTTTGRRTWKSTANHTVQRSGDLTDRMRLEREEGIVLAADGQSEFGGSLSTLPPPYFPRSCASTGNLG